MSGALSKPVAGYLRKYPILYVDDEDANLLVFRLTFGEEFDLIFANSGAAALEIAARRPVAILLTDNRMPGMTGVELCEQFRAKYPSVQRLLVTAYANQRSAIEGINRAGLTRYLVKPWNADHLREVLRESILRAHLDATSNALRGAMLERERIASASAARVRIALDAARMSEVMAQCCRSLECIAEVVASSDDGGAHGVLSDAISNLRAAASFGHSLRSSVGQTRVDLGQSPSVLHASELLETVVRIIGEGGPPVRVEADANLEVYADEVDVYRILVNLTENARQSIAEACIADGEVRVLATRADDRAVFTVSDTGPGVDAAARDRLFEPFFTTRGDRGASGLGLAVCEVLATANGGEVGFVADGPDPGASFSLSLPVPRG